MTRRRFLTLLAGLLGLAGCHTVTLTKVDYYEPTKETLHTREDGNVVGALKSEIIRSGARDEGDKTFAFGVLQSVGD